MRAAELLRNKFGVSQLYKHEVKIDGEVVFGGVLASTDHCREGVNSKKSVDSDDASDFAFSLMLRKALDEDGKRLFQDGEKAVLKNSVEASVLQDIQLAMLTSGTENKVEEAKADLKS